jgi:hypothetical protein
MIDGFAGDPTASLNSFDTLFQVWNQTDDDATEFYVYRPTFDWLP